MRPVIDLETTKFDFASVLSVSWEPIIDTMHKEKWIRTKDFGVILIGRDPTNEFNRHVCDISADGGGAPVFVAPVTWRMPHILRALGVFKSAGDAARNGWNMDVPEGLSQHCLKINRIFGCLHIFKAMPGVDPNPTIWEE